MISPLILAGPDVTSTLIAALFGPFLFLFFFLVVIVIIVGAWWWAKKREGDMKAFAQMNGYTFSASDPALAQPMTTAATPSTVNTFIGSLFAPAPPLRPWMQFGLFNAGHSRRLHNFLSRTDTTNELYVSDYTYTTGSGKHSSTYIQTVIIQKCAKQIPQFTLSREGLFQKVLNAVGFSDINFDTNPEFSKKFTLNGKDVAGIKALFSSPVLSYFVSHDVQVHVESNGQYLLVYRPGMTIPVNELKMRIDDALHIHDLFAQ